MGVLAMLYMAMLAVVLPLTADTHPAKVNPAGTQHAREIKEQEQAWLAKLDMVVVPTSPPPAVPEYMQVLYADMENQPDVFTSHMMALAMWPHSVEIMGHQLRADIQLSRQFYKHKESINKVELMLKRHDQNSASLQMQIELCSQKGRCDFATNLGMRQFEGEIAVWDVFDITEVVSVWLFHGETGESVIVDLTLNSENRFDSFPTTYDISIGQPDVLFVAYVNMMSSFPLPSHPSALTRRRRQVAHEAERSTRLEDYIPETGNDRSRRETLCQMHRWMLRMEDIGWDNWIISPQTMVPNVCLGSCAGLSNNQVNRTNHAFLRQMYLTRVDASQQSPPIPVGPTCIPLRFEKHTILYYAGGDQIIIKDLPEMVATACGCL